MINVPCTYPYNAKPLTMVLCILLFGYGGWFMTNEAMTNDRGAIIEHMITLDTGQATVMYWVFAGFCILALILASLSLVRTFTSPMSLRLDHDSLVLPHGFMQRKTTRIPYASIEKIDESYVSRQKFLYLHTRNKKYSIVASLLPSNQVFEEIKAFLAKQITG